MFASKACWLELLVWVAGCLFLPPKVVSVVAEGAVPFLRFVANALVLAIKARGPSEAVCQHVLGSTWVLDRV